MLTPEVILEINKKVIGIVKNAQYHDVYVCILCLAQINSTVVRTVYYACYSRTTTHSHWQKKSICALAANATLSVIWVCLLYGT